MPSLGDPEASWPELAVLAETVVTVRVTVRVCCESTSVLWPGLDFSRAGEEKPVPCLLLEPTLTPWM